MMLRSRKTRQKELIKKEIGRIDSFFSSEDLYKRVNKKDEKIGIATVYRILRDLKERDKLHSYICKRRMIYSKDRKSHCHFKCQECGKIFHLSIKFIDFLKEKVGSVCHFQIDVEGVCENCQKNLVNF